MLTEYHSEALAIWAYRHRVWDYRVKPITDKVLSRVLGALARCASKTSRTHGSPTACLPN